jgi:transposase
MKSFRYWPASAGICPSIAIHSQPAQLPPLPAYWIRKPSEEAIEARGAIPFYLPAYSPDLNPIEQLFAKLKALLRKVAAYTLKNAAFTVRSLCKAVASCLNQISRTECAAYLANSGYGPPKRKPL